MAVAYRSDTGALIVNDVSSAQTISFVSTQPSAGDLVVAGGGFYAGSTFTATVSDNQGNGTYTNDVAQNAEAAGTGAKAVIASKTNVASSGTFTMSFNSSVSPWSICLCAIAFSGATGGIDVIASTRTENADQSSQVTGTTATTAQADAVSVIALSVGNGNNLTTLTSTGYTTRMTSPNGAAFLVGALAYKILSATGTQAATWTYGATSGAATNDHAAGIAVYKAAPPAITPTIAWLTA